MESKIGVPLKELAPLCRKAAAEGMVLLKNENHMLPIKEEDNIALFGRCQIDYYRSGTGSGGAVNVEYATNLLGGLRSYPHVHLNERLAGVYENWIKEHPFDNGGGGWAAEPWHQAEMPLTDDLVMEAAKVSNKAFVVIGRTAGEDQDNADEPGSYRLTKEEEDMICLVTKYFSQTAILFNVSNIIDMNWITADWCHGSIKALLYTWQGGQEGGNASADILAGAVSPSGRLTDTIAYKIEDYPAHANYGDKLCNIYEEDIYVGYRYFETFCPEKVMFPFGFGLSYTTFAWVLKNVEKKGEGKDGSILIEAEITNTGSYAGKEVLQVYVEAPQGRLGQPKRVLAGFAKSKELQPGESCTLMIETKVKSFASYDDGGVTGYKSCYVLEAGAYRFHVGEDCRSTKEALMAGEAPFMVKETLVVERLQEAASPVRPFQRIKPERMEDGTYRIAYEPVPQRTFDLGKRIMENLPAPLPATDRQDILFQDVKAGRATLEEFTAQLSVPEMAVLVRGEGMCSAKVTPGTAAAFGGITEELMERGIPAGCAADGPSGLRMDTGEKATQLPIGTLLACSFNTELMEELFYLEGKELVQNNIDTLLGPGINIHRHALNGRNFEYFSEDPYVTGMFAAACERGLDRAGTMGTMKHYACNSQEKARRTVEAVISERALREIYLKGYEIAVKEGGSRAVMTSYNPVNSYQAASHYDLTTTILREEWGFDGLVMTDWWSSMNDAIHAGKSDVRNTAAMLRAQNDLFMVVNNNGAAVNAIGDDTESAVAEGRLTIGELQRCVMNILRFLLASPAAGREIKPVKPEFFEPMAEEGQETKTLQAIGKVDISEGRLDKESIFLKVENDGIYDVNVSLKSTQSDRAQMLSQIYLNGRKAVDIQTNGTFGRWMSQRVAKVELGKGLYEMNLCHVRPGIELSYIEFTRNPEK